MCVVYIKTFWLDFSYPQPALFSLDHFGHFCWGNLATETFQSFVSQLYYNSQ